MKRLILSACLIFVITVLASAHFACGSEPVTTLSDIPTIVSFAATHTKIIEGEPAVICWSVDNATSIQIEPGVGNELDASGCDFISLDSSKTLTLKASNSSGSVARSIVVTPEFLPNIVVFDISPNVLHLSGPGASLTAEMRWQVNNATSVKITGPANSLFSGTRVEHSGSQQILLTQEKIELLIVGLGSPTPTAYGVIFPGKLIYTLEATNENGTVTRTASLEVIQ